MAVTLDELEKLAAEAGLPHTALPDGKGLAIEGPGVSTQPRFVIRLVQEGRLVQIRTVGFQSCRAYDPHIKEVLALLRELDGQSRSVRFDWDPAGGEIVVRADIQAGDGKITREQFQEALSAFLQAIDRPLYDRIKTTMETGVDPILPRALRETERTLEELQEILGGDEKRLGLRDRYMAKIRRRARDSFREPEARRPGSSAGPDVPAWLAALGRARGAMKRFVSTPYTPDAVDCAVFSQREVQPGDSAFVQVFAYMPGYAEEAQARARECDDEAKKLGSVSLATEIMRGSTLMFELALRGLAIPDPVKSLVWRGETQSVQFEVPVPPDWGPRNLVGHVLISQGTVPIGQVLFKIKVVARDAAADTKPLPTGEARRYRTAFISYASKDRPEVIKRVQMLKAVGITCHQDVIDLDPGDRWAQKLYRYIDESDVLFLFWSTAARESEWVKREWQYGLERKGEDFIRPVIIEGPPPPQPPPELAHLHFADRTLYFINGA